MTVAAASSGATCNCPLQQIHVGHVVWDAVSENVFDLTDFPKDPVISQNYNEKTIKKHNFLSLNPYIFEW